MNPSPDDGFEGVAPKTEPDVAAPPPPDVEDAPKVPLVGVPVEAATVAESVY